MAITSDQIYALAKSPAFRQRVIALISRKVGFVEQEPRGSMSNNTLSARFSLARQAKLTPEALCEPFAWACADDQAIQNEAYPPNGTGPTLDPLAVDEARIINVIDSQWSSVAGV